VVRGEELFESRGCAACHGKDAQGTMGPGMMGGWSFGPYGWIGMLFMWLIPIGLFALTILGVVWLARAVGGGGNPVVPGRSCPTCGRSVQTDWRNCPYCGTGLTQPS
jgi:hypothetical protein